MRRFLGLLAIVGMTLTLTGCIHHLQHHSRNSPVKKFLKKRHAAHMGKGQSN